MLSSASYTYRVASHNGVAHMTTFIDWWNALNIALAARGEPEALWQEARAWWEWRPVKFIDERLINRVINDRKPL